MNDVLFNQQRERLNPQQREAVDTLYGPVMVVAGPGTGKTQMLALRIANILQQTDTTAQSMLCLTFTEAAAQAMRMRLMKFIGKDAYYVAIKTFHGFANDIIQSHPDIFSFSKELRQLDDVQRIKFLREIIDTTEEIEKLRTFYNPYHYQADITMALQNLKKEGITPKLFKENVEHILKVHNEQMQINKKTGKPKTNWSNRLKKIEKMQELGIIYEQYQNLLEAEGYYDYEDMIMFVIEAFREDDTLLARYQEQYQFILVDEYQDTNGAQNEILTLLGSFDDTPNLFVVGDDDQAIYRFQGANIDNILSFQQRFKEVKTIATITNYRSTQTILDAADAVIDANEARLTKKVPDLVKQLQAASGNRGEKIEQWEFATSDEELLWIAEKIEALQTEGVAYDDIAVLFRKNRHAEPIASVLQKSNIPTQITVSENAFHNHRVQELLRILEALQLYEKAANEHVYEILTYTFFSIPLVDIFRITKHAYETKRSLIEILLDPQESDTTFITEPLQQFVVLFSQWHIQAVQGRMTSLLEQIISASGMIDHVLAKDSDTTNDTGEESGQLQDVLALNSFFDFVSQQERSHPDMSINSLLADVQLALDNNITITLPKSQPDTEAVHLLTAHSAKGLEFKHVFIVHAVEKNWGVSRVHSSLVLPEILQDDAMRDIEQANIHEKAALLEDERRLFFVALTRAKEHVYITHAQEYLDGNNSTVGTPSQFITEIPEQLLIKKVFAEEGSFSLQAYASLLQPQSAVSFVDAERAYLLEQINQLKLSPSALNEYIRSPQEFLRNRLIRAPRAQNHMLALGSALHAALESMNRALKQGKNVSKELILQAFNTALQRGFAGDEKYDDALKEGTTILQNYLEAYDMQFTVPAEIEYSFGQHQVFLDMPDDEPIALTGRLDKIEWIDKENMEVKVVDYKNTRAKSENEVRGLTKSSDGSYWRQLLFYQLLGDLDTQFRPQQGNTLQRYYIGAAEIDFLKPATNGNFVKRTFTISSTDTFEIKDIIREVMRRIRSLEFPEESGI